MQGLRIAKPAKYAEGEEVNLNAVARYLNRSSKHPQVVEAEEEVWQVPLNLFNKKYTPIGNTNKNKSNNLWWANKPSTPKAQTIKAKNQPPKVKSKGNSRKTRKGRKTRKQNRR